MLKNLVSALALIPLLAGGAHAAAPKMTKAVRAELVTALKVSWDVKTLTRPSFRGAISKVDNHYEARVTLMGMGNSGPIFLPGRPLQRIGFENAWVKLNAQGKPVGKVQTSPIYRALHLASVAR